MKNYIFKFNGLGYNDCFQAIVKIYDSNNNLICCETTYNGQLCVCLECNKIYKVVASTLYNNLCKTIYLDCCHDKYIFYFPWSIYNEPSNIATFLLTDANYSGLKIERGELFLWQSQ